MWFIGIDWAKKHLDFCITNEFGDVILRSRVDNNDDGFNSMLNQLMQSSVSLDDVAVAIESPHQRVVDFLLARGVDVYPVNPTAVCDYRKSRFPSGSSSDPAAAQLIADYLREHLKHLRVWCIPEPDLRQLQVLVFDRDKLVQQKVRLHNQLTSTLNDYFPQALSAFSDITTQTALDFLERFPTFEAAQSQTEEEAKSFLDEHRCFHPKARQRFFEAMRLNPIEIDDAVVKAKSLLVTAIVAQLKSVVESLKEYLKVISTLLSKFLDGRRFRSLPGVDIILAAKLLVSIGIDRERFSSANELQSFYGTAPYTKSSGEHRSVHFRKACHKVMRAALEQMAFSSLRNSAWAKSYYSRKRKEGKKAHHALRCLANAWLKVIFAMWRNQENYDETLHLASIARHQINQPVATPP